MCADFLAERGEESSPEEILLVIHRLIGLLPAEYQVRIPSQLTQPGDDQPEAPHRC